MNLIKCVIGRGSDRVKCIKRYSSFADKVFCIGRNKTGTTSIAAALNELGYRVAPQRPAEMLLEDWSRRDFKKLKRFCRRYDAFQDVPFSYPFTFQEMDQAFPHAKFILTVRDSADAWYRSLTSFHAKGTGAAGIPTAEDVKQHPYRYQGYVWDCQRWLYGISEEQAYDPDLYKAHYEAYNAAVIDYFRWKPGKLLVLNVKEPFAYWNLANFLGKSVAKDTVFPWENKT
jgi:hypothetical protein